MVSINMLNQGDISMKSESDKIEDLTRKVSNGQQITGIDKLDLRRFTGHPAHVINRQAQALLVEAVGTITQLAGLAGVDVTHLARLNEEFVQLEDKLSELALTYAEQRDGFYE